MAPKLLQPCSLPTVKLYFCPLDLSSMNFAQAQMIKSWLSEDESVKVSRYIQLTARDKGLMVRGYLRGILSICSGYKHDEPKADKGIAPGDWRFQYGEKGKPSLVPEQREMTGLEFNISHSGDWLVIAVIKQSWYESGSLGARSMAENVELGVDIERYRTSTNIYPILNHYFTQDESESLLALDEHEQRERFFDLWALKESYIKAKGLGLALSLKSFSFGFSQVTDHELALYEDNTLIETLSLMSNLNLNFHKEVSLTESRQDTVSKSASDEWSLFLGRLNSEYRFAVSIGSAGDFGLEANKMDLSRLLTRYQ
ncbi:4'-phosphopantetheinyl transferase superfamily protein [Shewanella canadensis]|uniref:4'-phosphopantetheinyl transferase superfamily protein n=1 Tax=Shewanella canadensis TaxID=271096 RepID=A0A3S0IT95_9GAMM|nr:4'-phosphopantetheinyl transferase superfamily protein [Shewanella canadensis]RTR39229.1 4'-phosphopantetheinyl transferase superfamily protein [Shewanella canadensis]